MIRWGTKKNIVQESLEQASRLDPTVSSPPSEHSGITDTLLAA